MNYTDGLGKQKFTHDLLGNFSPHLLKPALAEAITLCFR